MLEFRTSHARGEAFASRDAYLRKKTLSGSFEAFLCHAMERVNRPLTKAHPKKLEQDEESGLTTGFPWLTLVLGSGCLEARAMDDVEAIGGAPATVRRLLQDERLLPSGEEPGSVAEAFARSLIADRLGSQALSEREAGRCEGPGARRNEDSPNGELDETSARVVLLAALLTRFYYRTRAISPEGTSRWGDGVAELRETYDDAESKALVLNPALALLDSLLDGPGSEHAAITDVLEKVLEQIRADLRPPYGRPRLQAMRLKVLNELSWHRLMGKSLMYPGWSDLLLDLSLHDGLPPLRHGQPRPTFTKLDEGVDWIRERYKGTTDRSWEGRSGSSGCETFYERAAGVIVQQAILRHKALPAWKPPIASAFVTTFDLELELALLTHPEKRPFVVAVPIYVPTYEYAEDQWRASLLWLGCIIEPDPSEDRGTQLERLLKPSKWLVLSGSTKYKSKVFGMDPEDGKPLLYSDLPTVVRLGGCPLIGLPSVGDESHLGRCLQAVLTGSSVDKVDTSPEDGALNDHANGESIDIEHAVLLDEYTALHQNAIDRYAYSPTQAEHKHTFGLPQEMTGAPRPDWMTRFWMVLGVQMGDSAVRYRIASHLAPPLEPQPLHGKGQPDRAGVAINRRLDAADEELLAWLGFDTVAAGCSDFAIDLEHYVEHVRSPKPRGLSGQACPLK